jgi:hypothetical protein
MPAPVRLSDIVDALEMQSDELSSFLELDTGRVETISDDLVRDAEECGDSQEPDLPDWQDEEWEIARRIVSSDRFLKLPTKFEVHEWEIMREFADSLESGKIREDLLHALHGSGAFRHFKDAIRRQGVESAWFAFRTEALRQIAVDWCEENGVSPVE